jgi:hypothetical protein
MTNYKSSDELLRITTTGLIASQDMTERNDNHGSIRMSVTASNPRRDCKEVQKGIQITCISSRHRGRDPKRVMLQAVRHFRHNQH